MEEQKPKTSEERPTQKEPYEPPEATFVELKIEERLLTCSKLRPQPPDNCRPGRLT